jgi:hypothetical protein
MRKLQEISKDKYMYALEVLPPLLMGVKMVTTFLRDLDKHPEIAEILNFEFDDLFLQGEGWDKHDVYGTKDGKYFIVTQTANNWNTEDFRYEDGMHNMCKLVHDALNKHTYKEKLNNSQEVIRFKRVSKHDRQSQKEQRNEFERLAKKGKIVCLSDLMANHGM